LAGEGKGVGMGTQPERPGRSDAIERSRRNGRREAQSGEYRQRDNCSHFPRAETDRSGLAQPSLIRLQRSDVFDDCVDLRIAEDFAESRHRAFLAELDALAEEIIVVRRIHELRPLAGAPAAVGMTIAAGGRKQWADI